MSEAAAGQTLTLGELEQPFKERLGRLEQENFTARLWQRDGSLWKADPQARAQIQNSLGWLDVPAKMVQDLGGFQDFAREVRESGFRHVVHMGMGGSSLAPLAFGCIFGAAPDGLPLTVLDTTDPATIKAVQKQVPLTETLFIVASKSGTTAEPQAFLEYFFDRVKQFKANAGDNFVAITDPGSLLAEQALERGFRRVFLNFPDIGGRYSALSYFGLVPAALLGLEVSELLKRALNMAQASWAPQSARDNPAVALGAALGECARRGRDKVTFLMPAPLAPLGMWLEQLLAESTGKEGTGLLPVAGEAAGPPAAYGGDRVFVHLDFRQMPAAPLAQAVAALRQAGHPVVAIDLDDAYDLGREMFRWEVATATAGAVLGINPFDQPNVQESKDNTNRLLAQVKAAGSLPREEPSVTEAPLSLYGQKGGDLSEALARFLGQAQGGDYAAVLAYLTEEPATGEALEAIRLTLRDRLKVATTVGFGPRYLHSTGQLHKGGPNTGLFLLLTADVREDPPIPGQPYGFAPFFQAQALGDLESLRRHGRRVVRVHLGAAAAPGLAKLNDALRAALAKG